MDADFSLEYNRNNSIAFGIITLVASILGICSIALGWVNIDLGVLGTLFSESNILTFTGLDLFDIGGDEWQTYIPVIIAGLSVIGVIIGIVQMATKSNGLGIGSIIIGIVVLALVGLMYLWIEEGINSLPEYSMVTPEISIGLGFYVALVSGILMLISGILSVADRN